MDLFSNNYLTREVVVVLLTGPIIHTKHLSIFIALPVY